MIRRLHRAYATQLLSPAGCAASASRSTFLASSPFSTQSRIRLPSLAPSTATPSRTTARGISSEAAALQELDEELAREELEAEKQELAELAESIEPTLHDPPPHSIPRTPLPLTATPRIPPLPKKQHDPATLLRPVIPSGGPTVADLHYLRPRRRIIIPTADSAASVRQIYERTWTSAQSNLDRSFNKIQLRTLVGPKEKGGLGLDVDDPRTAPVTKAKHKRVFKGKPLATMSKRELMRMVLITYWGMVDPDKIPAPRKEVRVNEFVELSDRTLFLLLVPDGVTISSLTGTHDVKLSFTKDPVTSVLTVAINGAADAVAAAKQDLLELTEYAERAEFELPLPATTMRPEVYQAISRLSKVFLEPGSEPEVLIATATDARHITRVEHLLNSAFVHNTIESNTPLFASFVANATQTLYNPVANRFSMYPFSPTTAPSWTVTPSTSFARVRALQLTDPETPSLASLTASGKAALELTAWSAKMRFERATRIALDEERHPDILESLMSAFEEGERVEMRGEFGHVLWPLFNGANSALEPLLNGVWTFGKFVKWRATQTGNSSVFIPNPPSGFLNTTGILTPTAAPSPFGVLLNSVTETAVDLSTFPLVKGTDLRRLVYRPVELPEDGDANITIELEYPSSGSEGEVAIWRRKTAQARIMVPDGGSDFQITLSSCTKLDAVDFPALTETSKGPTRASLNLTYSADAYLLDGDLTLRSTNIIPPRNIDPATPASYSSIQERWTDAMYSAESSKTELLLGESVNEKGELTALWKEGIVEMERRAKSDRSGLIGSQAPQVLRRT